MIFEILVGITLMIVGGYVLWFILFIWGWHRMPAPEAPLLDPSSAPLISVMIPARNEEQHIGACLESLSKQTYPRSSLDIIVVDDHSTDRTLQIAQGFETSLPLRVLSLASFIGDEDRRGAMKKQALSLGVSQARGEIILTTDADCLLPADWVAEMSQLHVSPKAQMVFGPVKYKTESTLLSLFQTLDFMAMQGITVAVHQCRLGIMGNGANLGFRKAAFEQVGGYKGIDHLASGDDYLLMEKMRTEFGPVFQFRKTTRAMVVTHPPQCWSAFWSQRIRWASKSGKYKDPILHVCLAWVYLMNLALIIWTCSAFWTGDWGIPASLFAIKLFVELVFLIPVSRFFGQGSLLVFYPFLQPLHWAYIVLAGTWGWKGEYQWKGRRTR